MVRPRVSSSASYTTAAPPRPASPTMRKGVAGAAEVNTVPFWMGASPPSEGKPRRPRHRSRRSRAPGAEMSRASTRSRAAQAAARSPRDARRSACWSNPPVLLTEPSMARASAGSPRCWSSSAVSTRSGSLKGVTRLALRRASMASFSWEVPIIERIAAMASSSARGSPRAIPRSFRRAATSLVAGSGAGKGRAEGGAGVTGSSSRRKSLRHQLKTAPEAAVGPRVPCGARRRSRGRGRPRRRSCR